MRDLMDNIHAIEALAPAAATTDNTAFVSNIIDTQGYGSCMFLLLFGSLADADATFTALLEDGNDSGLSDHATVDPSQVLGTVALASALFSDDNKTKEIGYIGDKRYVRLTVTPANNTGNAFLAMAAILGHPALKATANPPT
jgi:hypothetical protein